MKNFQLDLTEEDINIIGGALSQLPFYKVAQLIYKIQEKIEEDEVSDDKNDQNQQLQPKVRP